MVILVANPSFLRLFVLPTSILRNHLLITPPLLPPGRLKPGLAGNWATCAYVVTVIVGPSVLRLLVLGLPLSYVQYVSCDLEL